MGTPTWKWIGNQPWRVGSEFNATDLRLVADLFSHPLTRAMRNNMLNWCSPVWSDETHKALARIGDSRSNSVVVAIRRKRLSFVEKVGWTLGLSAIETVFALNKSRHLFRSKPSINWAKFTEPQLTKGFAHFLDAPDLTVRTERVRALLKALGAAYLSNEINKVKVRAEARTSEKKRIDLLIEWQDSENECYAVIIEAKLDHEVTPGQLDDYEEHVRKIPSARRLLVVVSPRLTRRINERLQDKQEWHWMAWHELLVAYERFLRNEHDDPEYVGFRRILWDQTG